MKTKNFLLTGALLIVALFSVNGVMAEGPSDYEANKLSSDAVTVNLKFAPIQSIQVNPDQKEINFEYNSPTDYSAGTIDNISQTLKDHLTVYHSGPFEVKVTSSGFIKEGSTSTLLEGDNVTITALKGSNIPTSRNNFDFSKSPSLSTGTKEFFSSQGGGMGLTFSVIYDHNGWQNESTYIDLTSQGETSVYTAEVTYTIVSN